MEARKVGVLLRSFAKTPDKVQGTVDKLIRVIKAILLYGDSSWMVWSIVVAIPTGGTYKDSDCGELATALRNALESLPREVDVSTVQVIESGLEDLFVGLQNHAAREFTEQKMDVMLTIAPSAFEAGYFDPDTADAMMGAFASGAKVVSVAVPEDGIDEFVARGTAGGPIIAWDLQALNKVRGFDHAAAQPKVGEENPNAGCEEIHPIVNMVRLYGPCYAPIVPHNVAAKKRELTGDDLKRHEKQIETKTARQMAHAASRSIDHEHFLEYFAAGVMPEYRLESQHGAVE